MDRIRNSLKGDSVCLFFIFCLDGHVGGASSKTLDPEIPRGADVQMPMRHSKEIRPEMVHSTVPAEEEPLSPRKKSSKRNFSLLFDISVFLADGNDRNQLFTGPRSRGVLLESHWVTCVWILFNFFLIILTAWNDSLGFSQTWNETGSGPLGEFFDWIVITVFILDIFAQFNMAYEDKAGNQVATRWEISKNYLQSWFVFDVAVALPFQGPRQGRIAKSF